MRKVAHTGIEKKPAKGRLLNIASVLLMVYGVLATVMAVLMLVSVESLVSLAGDPLLGDASEDLPALLGFALIAGIISLAQAILSFVAGIVGRRVHKGKMRAETCQMLGIVLVGVAFIAMLFSCLVSGFAISVVLTFVASSVLPLLLYFGARSQVKSDFWEGVREAEDESAAEPDGAERVSTVRRYCLNERLEACSPQAAANVEVMTLAAFKEAYPEAHRRLSLARPSGRFTLDATGCGMAVSFMLPNVSATAESVASCSFWLGDARLVLATDDSCVADLFDEFARVALFDEPRMAAVLIGFLEHAIKDDIAYLYEQERRLDRLEDNMTEDVNEIPEDFDVFVTQKRRLLRELHGFYRQYADLANALQDVECVALSDAEARRLQAIEKNALRLAEDANELGDYILRIKDFYQAKIDVRQNKVMQTLTIVTSVFMPLTLITGWYGMNFEVMPELHWKGSYFIVMSIAIVIVTLEVVIFKRKKWF